MTDLFGIPIQALLGQLLLGLVNGSFYAMLSLGLAVIFGLLNVINFAHGALYMLGAFVAWMGLSYLGLNYWVMLILARWSSGCSAYSLKNYCSSTCTSWTIFTGC
ncbi:LIV-I protein H [Achromobacter denitrificans]|nr:LIV-I protein H [Achromobacter denitrificans]